MVSVLTQALLRTNEVIQRLVYYVLNTGVANMSVDRTALDTCLTAAVQYLLCRRYNYGKLYWSF